MDSFLSILTDNPMLRAMQMALLGGAVVAIYLVFYATRDVILRTRSLAYQLLCILIVAALPVLGFFVYLLIRPATTLRERETERMLRKLLKKDLKEIKEIKESKEDKE